jgi:putative membrane protein insertion efficiency factor
MQKEFAKRDVDSSNAGTDQELEIGLNSSQTMASKSDELLTEKSPHKNKGHRGEYEGHEAEPDLRDLPFTLANIPRFIVLGLIRAYQATFSRTLPQDTCRFYPSCSHYGYQAIYKYGVLKGGLMAAWRVLRCNPFNKGGFDPVK